MELGVDFGWEFGDQEVVKTDVVVGAVAGGLVGEDEAVVDEEFVVGVCAVGGEDFFVDGWEVLVRAWTC